jgi:hypothetical protein
MAKKKKVVLVEDTHGPLWYEEKCSTDYVYNFIDGKYTEIPLSTNKGPCQNCGKGKLKLQKFTYPITLLDKSTVRVKVEGYRCSVCSYTIFTEEQISKMRKMIK